MREWGLHDVASSDAIQVERVLARKQEYPFTVLMELAEISYALQKKSASLRPSNLPVQSCRSIHLTFIEGHRMASGSLLNRRPAMEQNSLPPLAEVCTPNGTKERCFRILTTTNRFYRVCQGIMVNRSILGVDTTRLGALADPADPAISTKHAPSLQYRSLPAEVGSRRRRTRNPLPMGAKIHARSVRSTQSR